MQVNTTVTDWLVHVPAWYAPLRVEPATVSCGAVKSMFNAGEVVKEAELPDLSVTTTVLVRPVPSTLITTGLPGKLDATPERLSAVIYANDTLVLFQPAAFAGGLAALNANVGGTLSMTNWSCETSVVAVIIAAAGTVAAELTYCPVAVAVKVTSPLPPPALQEKLKS